MLLLFCNLPQSLDRATLIRKLCVQKEEEKDLNSALVRPQKLPEFPTIIFKQVGILAVATIFFRICNTVTDHHSSRFRAKVGILQSIK